MPKESVYLLSNEAMPGLYKIGRTRLEPWRRAQQLSGATGVPCEFEVLCWIEVQNGPIVEAALHEHFDAQRVSSRREFFCIDDVEEVVEQMCVFKGATFREGCLSQHRVAAARAARK